MDTYFLLNEDDTVIKNASISARRLMMTLITLLLGSSVVFAAARIPGINIVIKTHPGGVVVSTNTSDVKGIVVSRKLEKGTYSLEFSKVKRPTRSTLDPFDLLLTTSGRVMVNGTLWDKRKAIRVSGGTKIEITLMVSGTSLVAAISECTGYEQKEPSY